MSQFANPYSEVQNDEAKACAASLVELLGGRNPLSESDVNEALREFTSIRRSNVRLFERASDADLERVGIHSERGEESLGRLMDVYAGHDLVHLRQIKRIRRAVEAVSLQPRSHA